MAFHALTIIVKDAAAFNLEEQPVFLSKDVTGKKSLYGDLGQRLKSRKRVLTSFIFRPFFVPNTVLLQ